MIFHARIVLIILHVRLQIPHVGDARNCDAVDLHTCVDVARTDRGCSGCRRKSGQRQED